MLSKTCEYALRAIVYIALATERTKLIRLKDITDKLDIPAHFLGKIMQVLVKQCILGSTKGPNGGFYIPEKTLTMPVIEVIKIIDGSQVFKQCGLGQESCSHEKPCVFHADFQLFRDGILQTFTNKTITDYVIQIKQNEAILF